MGYYTRYKLDVITTDGTEEYEIITALREACCEAHYALDEGGDTEESATWYDYETDLVNFSKTYPDAVFELSGKGEESGDIWKYYVKNGEGVRAKAVMTIAPNPFLGNEVY